MYSFCFLMVRLSPRSTLFPYTTLFRSDLSRLHEIERHDADERGEDGEEARLVSQHRGARTRRARSEEHTSELQSHSDLVCRLLLEKKKGTTALPCCCMILTATE